MNGKINYSRLGIFVSLFILVSLFLAIGVSAADAVFSGPGTQSLNLAISSSKISDISLNITGLPNGDSYPSSIEIDVGRDGIIDWEYKVYPGTGQVKAENVLYVTSNVNSSGRIFFAEMNNDQKIYDLAGLGKLEKNVFHVSGTGNGGALGLTSVNVVSSQIITILTNSLVIHAFVPRIAPKSGTIGLYISEGGATYYCNSDHTFTYNTQCNLSPNEAMQPAHLAKEPDSASYNYSQIFKNPKIVDAINRRLIGCSSPCSIPLTVKSNTAGIVRVNSLDEISPAAPADINVIDSSTIYDVTINPHADLTESGYFYGEMPNVYVVPVIAGDDPSTITTAQVNRLLNLNSSLARRWDLLTNFQHPMKFTVYLNPYQLTGFRSGHDFSRMQYEVWNSLIPEINLTAPAILIILDLNDHFPDEHPYSVKRSLTPGGSFGSKGLINEIYINGLSDTLRTSLYNYDQEIFPNIILHELAHTFIDYPAVSGSTKFSGNHPASFNSLSDFTAYQPLQSPTKSEGYYEIYSIMNSVRLYMTAVDVNNTPMQLSPLDRMLLGTLSPHTPSLYTFYNATLVKGSARYSFLRISPNESYNANDLYKLSTDSLWWDVRNTPLVNMNKATRFSVPKSGQNGKALWVFAKDASNNQHFVVSNLNSFSTQLTLGSVDRGALVCNGILEVGEICDGNSRSCTINGYVGSQTCNLACSGWNTCVPSQRCGDGIVQTGARETCDDGNSNNEDSCKNDCTINAACKDEDRDGIIDYHNTYCPSGNDKVIESTIDDALYLPRFEQGEINLTYEVNGDLRNVSNFTIYKPGKGKIVFKDYLRAIGVNENGMFIPLNISALVQIVGKKIIVHSENFSEFNKPAIILFEEISFIEPIILRNGIQCGDVCANTQYNSARKTLTSEVPGFSEYEVIEGYSADGTVAGGGGGGGGGSTGQIANYSIWSDIYNYEDKELSEYGKIQRIMQEKERLYFKINTQRYYIAIVNISSNSTAVLLPSITTPQTIHSGKSSYFELNGDNYFDVLVIANITIDKRVNITIIPVKESINNRKIILNKDTSYRINEENQTTIVNKRKAEILSKGKINYSLLIINGIVLSLILFALYILYRIKIKQKGGN